MEIELKYSLDSVEQIDSILNDEEIKSMTDEGSLETFPIVSRYFDTADMRLTHERVAFRVRKEGRRYIATLKWNGHSESGMHEREENNVPVSEKEMSEPTVEIFKQSPMYEKLKQMIGERELSVLMTTEFERRQVRLDNGNVICELSFDTGEVHCDGRSAPLQEMEIELYSGSREEMEKIGEYITGKYGLKPENKSKFGRGLDLKK
ncbi:MAG: inorganic triphosphatase [Eubacterium sp.]